MASPPEPDHAVAHGLRTLDRDGLAAILAVTRALAGPFDLKSMLSAVTDAACRVLAAERSSVWLHDAARHEMVLEISSDVAAVRVPVGMGFVGVCARDRATLNVPDCYADPRFDPEVDRRSGFRTRCLLTLPLVDHRAELIGVMQVLNRQGGPFEADDVALAEALAAQCAVALSRVRMTESVIEGERLQRELEVARAVQMSTLPRTLPAVPGYEVGATFLPAEQTGGDTYDVAPLPQGVLLVVGDATGHGIAPALMVTQMHAMLRMALRLGADLETAFRHVNDQLADTFTDGRFVTAFVGLLDAAAHQVRFLSGGQAPILHYQAASRSFVRHGPTSFPMGAMPIVRLRPPVCIEMAPGDLLALITDGIYEHEDIAGDPFGADRVQALLAAHATATPAVLAERLLEAVRGHAGGAPQADDITMILLQRRAG